ncbi:hypothetical protein DTO012A7_9454 [Penicillium roqueforti]|uniref:uncharacterized protein n=1 Tax=Penicillium roqueforti TaxID=5082 RepID=UPI00190BD6D2|nr:uncharacterized protein LCP9604111_7393 [Penicillium roqueforti]KAF9243959.1 hypothetical protein LCP9604111_7393 [Penicillium roqueforti]KAI2684779.1 hypothetical protein LCP963914a_4871 [Penicillium roqueforti]KAI2696188.1 hypothetical protein CBS147372_8679 [Penicillium roqueforti]KAI2718371.1 hypothetical protein CBS147318_4948 [Penicillium roqueforti]KAI3146182.1 hypothetical protein CBS147317_9437 [Penicillium roqueforti]
MPEYAKNQPAGFKNAIERVAIVGAGGTVGSHLVAALLKTGKHTVTALSRRDSSNKLPEGVLVAPVDYSNEATIVAALKGQEFFIITVSPTAPRDTHSKLVRAAAKAGVPYIMPNGYAGDIEHTKLGEDIMLGPVAQAARDEIESLGMKWITVCCGFWYDYSLAGGEARFGFDFDKRSLTIYDDGTTKNSVSTLSQVGRAVAKVLSFKVLPEDQNDKSLTVSRWLNKPVYIKSFVINQTEMFESVKRVTGTSDADWTITHEDSKKRYADGLTMVKTGNMAGFGKLLYARAFFPDDPGDCSAKAQNELLGLPEESLDEATRAGVDMKTQLADDLVAIRNKWLAALHTASSCRSRDIHHERVYVKLGGIEITNLSHLIHFEPAEYKAIVDDDLVDPDGEIQVLLEVKARHLVSTSSREVLMQQGLEMLAWVAETLGIEGSEGPRVPLSDSPIKRWVMLAQYATSVYFIVADLREGYIEYSMTGERSENPLDKKAFLKMEILGPFSIYSAEEMRMFGFLVVVLTVVQHRDWKKGKEV